MNLAQEDYYTAGKEPPGFWLGEAAREFGLSGMVAPEDFRNLLAGFTPDGIRPLVHNAGSAKRRSGWDLTWSVPKSVSVAWSQATPETRAAIEAAVRDAVRRAIRYLEGIGIVSRRGTDGVTQEKARLVFAAFEHATSRAQDPQLHVHTILLNLGVRPDGTTGTLDPRLLYRHQLAAGALFRAELAARLERGLGLRCRREGRCFEIIGVDPGLIEVFSKRRAQIEARLKELGATSAAVAEKVALDTRPDKEPLARETLLPQWQAVGRAHHWSTKELSWLLHAPFPPRDPEREAREANAAARQALTAQDSHFGARQVVQALAEEAQGRCLDADAVLRMQAQLLQSSNVVPLQDVAGEPQWTTREMLELETRVLSLATAMHHRERPTLGADRTIEAVLRRHPHLTDEQRFALRHVSVAERGIRVVSGMAGTGKSTLFRAANEVWTCQGRQVIGACLSGKAALELGQAAGISAQTIARTLIHLNRHELQLDANSVVLVDEAGMVGTRQMEAILTHCHRAAATLVLCGDARQLQAIEAGGAFREFAERFGGATLRGIQRQRELWAREAVVAFAEGRAEDALREYAGRGLLSAGREPEEVMAQLLADWKRDTATAVESAVILATRNLDVLALNRLAQADRHRSGHLGEEPITVGPNQFFAGDRIVFTRNSPEIGVFNGQTATLTEASPRRLTARLDRGPIVTFAPDHYDDLQLGYALTTHKAQGLTADRAFVYLDPAAENRELGYVQASRARTQCSLYAVAEDGLETGMNELTHALNRSRGKVLATTLLPTSTPTPMLSLGLSW